MSYFRNIKSAIVTTGIGLRLTIVQLFQALRTRKQNVMEEDFFSKDEGIATLQFPHETIPVPDNGRYKLHNEIDDCIVCDQCAKVCPVNCIDIVPIRSPEVYGETSDGTSKRIYAEKFTIDMSKCMFCGLCTTVCPTECLTMTSEYDYSTFNIEEHLFPFQNLTEQEASEKKSAWEKHMEEKAARTTKAAKPATPAESSDTEPKPAFKPRMKPKTTGEGDNVKPKPVFRPKVKSKSSDTGEEEKGKPKPVFRPKVPTKKTEGQIAATEEEKKKKKPVYRPKIQPRKPKNDD